MKKVELLAPAGNYKSFLGAIHAGADAVYIGGSKYGARAYAENFSEEEVCLAIRYAHLFGKKLYLTVNTLVRDYELEELYDYLSPFYKEGLDGVIVQDMGVFSLIKHCFPGLELHASTQMTITGAGGAEFIKEQGAARIVPARELSLSEIREIKETVDIEIEAFVHGAMCYCYSGQCLFSSLLGGRSGNRGKCAQPCRLPYQIFLSKEEIENKKRKQTEEDSYPLSLKDMCTLSIIPKLIEAGIDSFKIEGRMKKPEYAAGVTALYRKYIDMYYDNSKEKYQVSDADYDILRQLYMRSEIQEGYYFKKNGRDMITMNRPGYSGTDDQVLENIRKKYLSETKKVEIKGTVMIETGKPIQAAAGFGNSSVSVLGPVVLQAEKKPLQMEDVRKQLLKTGNTVFSFEQLNISIGENCFLPVKALNDLRRELLNSLEAALLKNYVRELPDFKQYEAFLNESRKKQSCLTTKEAGESVPFLAVSLEQPEQLNQILSKSYVRRVYLKIDWLLKDGQTDETLLNKIKSWKRMSAEHEVYFNMPWILRASDCSFLKEAEKKLAECAEIVDGVLIHNMESINWLNKISFLGKIQGDSNLYIWNKHARNFFESAGIQTSAPVECNKSDWHNIGISGMEAMVYGRIPLMVTANCVRRTGFSCQKNTDSFLYLTDRYQTVFPVKTDCNHCYNIIYNSVPLSLHNYRRSVLAEKPGSIRICLTTENREETETVLNLFHHFLCDDTLNETVDFQYTKGHYKRGAE